MLSSFHPKLQSDRTVQVFLRDISSTTFFSQQCTFRSARECRHIFPQCICEWTICAVKMVRVSKKVCWVVSRQQKWSFFCDTTFCLNKLTAYEPPYMVTPNCLWSVGCQIAQYQFWCFWPVLLQSWNETMWNATQLRLVFRGARGHYFARGLTFIESGPVVKPMWFSTIRWCTIFSN